MTMMVVTHDMGFAQRVADRMIGNDDGIIDGLFALTKPITGSYFWCPPVANGKLNLSAILDA